MAFDTTLWRATAAVLYDWLLMNSHSLVYPMLALHLQSAVVLALALAWAYVSLRAVHCYIHTGANKLMPRVYAYFLSWIALLALWATIGFKVATG